MWAGHSPVNPFGESLSTNLPSVLRLLQLLEVSDSLEIHRRATSMTSPAIALLKQLSHLLLSCTFTSAEGLLVLMSGFDLSVLCLSCFYWTLMELQMFFLAGQFSTWTLSLTKKSCFWKLCTVWFVSHLWNGATEVSSACLSMTKCSFVPAQTQTQWEKTCKHLQDEVKVADNLSGWPDAFMVQTILVL